jgi:N-methylhydantoinase B
MCIALFASTSHIADVGGRGFGPDANDLFEEGLRIPIGYLFAQGVRDETLFRLIAANVRDPVTAEGDLYSLTACNDLGAAALLELLEDFQIDDLVEIAQHIISASAAAMCAEIARLPQGCYRQHMRIDGYDEPVDLQVALTVSPDSIDLDFSGSSAVSARGINVPLPYTEAYASFGVRCLVGNQIPNNAGSLSLISVSAPDGCILNAQPPAAVSARHSIGQMLPDVVLGALAQVLPEAVPAEGASCIWNPVLRSVSSASAEDRFVTNPIFNGGTGARPGKDGLSTTAFPSGVRTTSTEVSEATTPLVVWRKEYRRDSGGAGEFRGGLGQIVEIGHRGEQPFVVSKMFDRIHHPARGRHGGEAGLPGRVYLQDGTVLSGKGRDLVPAGAILVIETPGGGGLGEAAERASQAVRIDLEAGLVSDVVDAGPAEKGNAGQE